MREFNDVELVTYLAAVSKGIEAVGLIVEKMPAAETSGGGDKFGGRHGGGGGRRRHMI
jgi:hypothetical protein